MPRRASAKALVLARSGRCSACGAGRPAQARMDDMAARAEDPSDVRHVLQRAPTGPGSSSRTSSWAASRAAPPSSAAALDWLAGPRTVPGFAPGTTSRVGAILRLLLTIDLGRPLRFWHAVQSRIPRPHVQGWSPILVRAWADLLFGLFSVLSALGARAKRGGSSCRAPRARRRREGGVASRRGRGGLLGLFIASYTGILLSSPTAPSGPTARGWGRCSQRRARRPARRRFILFSPGRGATERSLGWLSGIRRQGARGRACSC